MNREILFRGKRVDNNEWIYGDLLNWYDTENNNQYNPCIIPIECSVKGKSIRDFVVVPETIGQYTEINDENGVKIFEGDIVEIDKSVSNMFQIVSIGKVIFRYGSFFVAPLESENEFSLTSSLTTISNIYYIFRGEVKGNIYDKGVRK